MSSGDRLRIGVLGPLRVLDGDDRDVTPDGALQRRLLALLVLRRGHSVSADAAIDALWPAGAPRDPVAALHNQVFRLRRRLPEGVIESIGDGYRLDPTRVEVDADRLAEVLSAGGTGPDLIATIDATLDRWHGPAYPELDDVDDGRNEATRLAELRLRAREVGAEHRLAAGEHDAAVAELAALVDAEPLRERPRALLMDALARSGRRVEALRVFDDFRRRLGDELGIEPSPALAAQHADLLAASGVVGWAAATRLPVPATSLIGRDELVDEVATMVTTHRVVSLVGPGGVGKTRLAVEAGHRLRTALPDRPVVLCELATTDPESAVDAVAAAVRIDARPGVPMVERVTGVLGATALVLVLDNCEHVLEPVAELVERLVAECPNARVVATSRERLRVPGEHVRTVPPLPLADGDGPAVQLFLERARAVAPGFEPDASELQAIAEIVRRLDGLPLGIELAAARLHTHDVAEVAAGLDQRFSLLSSGPRTSPRHASLRAAVSWSYGLLDERLRRIFAELSVFASPFTAADAAAVCGEGAAGLGDALAQLTEQSLLLRAPGHRYVVLETLRAFGAEQLDASGAGDTVAGRHARHQVAWVEAADRRLLDDGSGAVGEIEAALPELRVALGWLLDHGEVELAGRLVVALRGYGIMRLRPDVLAWAERVAAADPQDRSPWASQVSSIAAYAVWLAGDVAGTGTRAERARQVADASGGPMPAVVATICGNVELFEGRLAEAASWYRRAVAAARDDPAQRLLAEGTLLLALAYAGDPEADDLAERVLAEVAGTTTASAAYTWFCAGEADLGRDEERARLRFTQAIHLAELSGASFVTGLAGASRASIDARLGDPRAAAGDYRRLIAHWRAAGVWSTQWTMLRSIALLLARLERWHDAAVLEGAVRATTEGHRIFGADEAALAELGEQLRAELGDAAYAAAVRDGAVLDGDAAVEHALRAL